MIGIHDPFISTEEERGALEALRSNWVSGGGSRVEAFEEEMRSFLEIRNAPLATVNGSGALVLALKALGVKPGDHVLVSSYGFVATANSVRQAGAEPIFIGPEVSRFPVVTRSQIESFLLDCVDKNGLSNQTGRPVRGMLYNQPYGFACPELSAAVALLQKRGMFLVEDASQSIGVKHDGKFLGTIGTMGVFSFNGNKTITTGAGGMLIGQNPELLKRARKLRNQSRSDPFDFFYDEEGNNFLMSNVLGAIGFEQARKLPTILSKKAALRECYRNLLKGSGISLAGHPTASYPAWLNLALFPRTCSNREVFRKLASAALEHGVQLRPAFPPVTDYPMYRDSPHYAGEHSAGLFDQAICLPSGAGISENEASKVIGVLVENAKKLSLC